MALKEKVVYLCGVDYQHELEQIPTEVYASVKQLKEKMPCWKECGIVKLKVTLEEWLEPQKLFSDNIIKQIKKRNKK